jgi:UDP-N-acetylglucosamine/UDP-N-acetylgalactosamine diphosphorylase
VSHIGDGGTLVEPEKPNAIRFERFIFDLLPLANQALVVESDPAEAFSPVKNSNAEQTDNPRTSQTALIALHTRWLREAGAKVIDGVKVEINPLWAGNVEEVKRRIKPGMVIDRPTYFAENGPRIC